LSIRALLRGKKRGTKKKYRKPFELESTPQIYGTGDQKASPMEGYCLRKVRERQWNYCPPYRKDREEGGATGC
jgi:hypothetical protein